MIILIILIIVLLLSLSLINKTLKNKKIVLNDTKLQENKINRKQFSMYVENENGEYDEYNSSNLFPSGYVLNKDKSACVDNNGKEVKDVLSSNGTGISVTSNKTLFCYIYFDIKKPSVTLTVSTDGTENTLPTYSHYKQALTCNDGTTSVFNTKYQRIEISNVGNTNTKCNLNYTKDTTSYSLLSTIVQNNGTKITSTNNEGGTDISYRYTGKTPSNYVWFNNEMWRIIGLVPVCTTSGCGTPTTSLVKIIRNESIGGLAYDAKTSGYTGAWGSNTLYKLLNNYYYGKSDGTGTDFCYGYYTSSYQPVPNCNYSKIGIANSETDYYGRMVENVYWNTGASSYFGTSNSVYKTETATQIVSGKIGLMSVSDYGYAGINYTIGMNLSTFANSTSSNWLYGQGYEWTSIQNSSNMGYALSFNIAGYIGYSSDTVNAVRPVIYLDSNVYIISGEGTENNPYVLGM